MAARKKKRPLRPRTPSRVKKRTKKRKHARAAHQHPELIGLALATFGLFLASLLYLGWEGGSSARRSRPPCATSSAGQPTSRRSH